jgi:predicted GNAT family acetyltransferase
VSAYAITVEKTEMPQPNINTSNLWTDEQHQARKVHCSELGEQDESEVLAFLAERSVHTFGLAGFIHTNGLVSPHNRGRFYSCRNEEGALEGVALIGHFVLFEARSEAAIAAFAQLAQDCPAVNMLLGESPKVQSFWHYYSQGGRPARLYCRELLLELRWPVEIYQEERGLRPATIDDLDIIVPAHAQSAFADSGVDPLVADPVGFRERCARRIEQGQTWVVEEGGKLLFKAETITDTPEVIYLEGVWVDPTMRRKGYGVRSLSQLSRNCLTRTSSVCLLVNERFQTALAFYKKTGYKLIGYYDTIFLQREAD